MAISILHVLAPAAVGGLERVVQSLAVGHARRGHPVTIAAIVDRDDPGHPFLALAKRSGLRVVPLEFPGRSYLRERRGVVSLIRRERPSVVHTHGYRADVVSGTAAVAVRVPTVTTVHGFTGGDWKNRIYEWLQNRAYRRFDCVVAVARPLVERLARGGVPRDRIRFVQNAWAAAGGPLERARARAALGLPPSGAVVGWVGRLSPEKGPDLFLDALDRLGEGEWTAAVLGEGREKERLRDRGARAPWAGRLHWLGLVPDAARYLPAFDLLVLSSRTEGTPIVLLEAMAAGVPIVATSVGGVPDVLSSGEARLVPPDDPDALAAAIRETLHHPDDAARRADLARERLERDFAPEPWLDAYEEVYRSVTRRNGRSA